MDFNLDNIPVFTSIGLSPDGKFLVFPESAAILGLFGDGKVLLVEQPRKTANINTLELPGGRIGAGEDKRKAVERELLEETGYLCEKTKLLFTLDMDFSASIHRTHVFIGELTDKHKPTEKFINRIFELNQLIALIHDGKITHAPTVAAIYWLKSEREE